MLLMHRCAKLGVLAMISSLLSCAVWPIGCSGQDAPDDRNSAASGKQETPHQASMQAIRSLLASADTMIIGSESRMALSSDLRQQLVGLMTASTVKPGGLRLGDRDPLDPPMPPPAVVLWVVDNRLSPALAKSEDAMAVIQVHVVFSPPFAHAYQPGKIEAFFLESDGWRTLVTAIEDEWDRATKRN